MQKDVSKKSRMLVVVYFDLGSANTFCTVLPYWCYLLGSGVWRSGELFAST